MTSAEPHLLTVAATSHPTEGQDFARAVVAAADVVAAALADFVVGRERLEEAVVADKGTVEAWLDGWAAEPAEAQIIYWIGHGRSDGDRDYYVGVGASARFDHTDALAHTYLARSLQDHQGQRKVREDAERPHWLVIILDTCDAYVGGRLLDQCFEPANQPDNLLVVGTNLREGETFAGEFAEELRLKLTEITGNQVNGIPIRRFFDERMHDRVSVWGNIDSRAVLRRRHAHPLAAPLDALQRIQEYLAGASPELRTHFYTKAKSGEHNEPGWFFVGREGERRQLAEWLDAGTGGMLVVTGPAGTGKSALLGRLLLSVDHEFEDMLIEAGELLAGERVFRPDRAIDLVIHLQNLRIEQVVQLVAQAFEIEIDRPHVVAEALGRVSAERGGGVTILADALDEAVHRVPIVEFLTQLASQDGVGVIVGTRPHAEQEPGLNLPDELSGSPRQVLTLEPPSASDRRGYAKLRLRGESSSVDHVVAERLADIADDFLSTRLALAEFVADPGFQDEVANRVSRELDLRAIYEHMRDRVRGTRPGAELALHALAYAHGKGIPRIGGAWLQAAEAVNRIRAQSPGTAAVGLDEDDLSWAMENLSTYIIEDSAEGDAVYRLSHQSVADFFMAVEPPVTPSSVDEWLVEVLPIVSAYRAHLSAQGVMSMSRATSRTDGPAHPRMSELRKRVEELQSEVALRERMLGADHPDTLTSRYNLAGAYESVGDLGRAIPLYEETLADRVRVLGADHPDTLTSRNNLAYAYRSVGDLGRAITLYEETLADRVRVLGADHPDTLTSRYNLAYAYRSVGDLGRAIPLYEETLADRVRVLGADHPDTLTSRNNLAYAYESAGDLGRAIPLYEETLADRVRVLGADHPDTLTSRYNLAYAYESAGDLGRAIPLYEETLADRVRVLGADHPDTLTSRNNLAGAYESAGDLGRAIPLYEETLADRVRVLGADHPDTLTSRNNLAGAYESAGDLGRAIPLYEETLADRVRVLGADHPDTLTSRNNLAYAYESAGDLGRAIPLYEETLADRVRVLGADHPNTLGSRTNLAGVYWGVGRTSEALVEFEEVAEVALRMLGPAHEVTRQLVRNRDAARQLLGNE